MAPDNDRDGDCDSNSDSDSANDSSSDSDSGSDSDSLFHWNGSPYPEGSSRGDDVEIHGEEVSAVGTSWHAAGVTGQEGMEGSRAQLDSDSNSESGGNSDRASATDSDSDSDLLRNVFHHG